MLEIASMKSSPARERATLRQAVRHLGGIFRDAGIGTAALDARLLAAEACGLSPQESIVESDLVLSALDAYRIEDFAARRLAGEPVSRIIGRREFWGLSFRISPGTLDPRPETELLVEAVLDYVRAEGLAGAPLRFLDLGTGSGCILGALLSVLPLSFGLGVDRCPEALTVARENLWRLGLLDRSAFLCADWVSALGDGTFDIIVCNPPYIESPAIPGLEREVRVYDPPQALDGGDDGLQAYRDILAQAFRSLRGKGLLVFETGHRQAKIVMDMMIRAAPGGFLEVQTLTDLGGAERAVAGVRQSPYYEPNSKKKIGNLALSG
jgi:release factor glutamine methyltransferase